jgi:hypothetical protein
VHYTTSCNKQSSAPEDGRDHRPKHVELIGIINKPLLLHLVGVYIICIMMYGHTNIKNFVDDEIQQDGKTGNVHCI